MLMHSVLQKNGCLLLSTKYNFLLCFFHWHRAKCILTLHLHSPALGKAVVWGGEEKGSRHRNETKRSRSHSCGLSPAPGEAGTALVKALAALKPAGIAEEMQEKSRHEEPVSRVEKANHRA